MNNLHAQASFQSNAGMAADLEKAGKQI